MKRKIAVAGAVLAGLISATPAVALADETPAPTDCAAAVVALNDANRAHQDAVRADKNADEAEEADRRLQLAENRLKDAQEAAADAKAELERRTTFERLVNENGTSSQDEKDAAKAAVIEQQEVVEEADELVDELTDQRDDAADAAASNALELRELANQTSTATTQRALDDARDDFTDLCGRAADDVVEDEDPAPVEKDKDSSSKSSSSKDMVVPSGGVDTGGGPA